MAVVDPEHKIGKGKNKRDHCRGNTPGETKAGTQYDEQPEASNTHRKRIGNKTQLNSLGSNTKKILKLQVDEMRTQEHNGF